MRFSLVRTRTTTSESEMSSDFKFDGFATYCGLLIGLGFGLVATAGKEAIANVSSRDVSLALCRSAALEVGTDGNAMCLTHGPQSQAAWTTAPPRP